MDAKLSCKRTTFTTKSPGDDLRPSGYRACPPLAKSGRTCRSVGWACYHTELYEFDHGGEHFGIIGCAVGASFAVLLAEQLFASVALSSLLGLVVFWGFGLLGQLLVGSWHESHRSTE